MEWNVELRSEIFKEPFQAKQAPTYSGSSLAHPTPRLLGGASDRQDYYHGGKFDFLRFRGLNVSSANNSVVPPEVMQCYTNSRIVQDFKNYIQHLISHVNPYTGLSYAEDPTIFAYETGNELGGTHFGDMDVPNEWTTEISSHVKSLAPHKWIVDGTYGVNKSHLSIDTIDTYSDHYYPLNVTKLQADIASVAAADKTYLAGEYDWTGNMKSSPSLKSFYSVIEAQ